SSRPRRLPCRAAPSSRRARERTGGSWSEPRGEPGAREASALILRAFSPGPHAFLLPGPTSGSIEPMSPTPEPPFGIVRVAPFAGFVQRFDDLIALHEPQIGRAHV